MIIIESVYIYIIIYMESCTYIIYDYIQLVIWGIGGSNPVTSRFANPMAQ